MRVKRWAALFLFGTILTGLAVAMGLVYSYRYVPFPEPISTIVQAVTLQFLPRELRFFLVFCWVWCVWESLSIGSPAR